jgi:hypothetical protein
MQHWTGNFQALGPPVSRNKGCLRHVKGGGTWFRLAGWQNACEWLGVDAAGFVSGCNWCVELQQLLLWLGVSGWVGAV